MRLLPVHLLASTVLTAALGALALAVALSSGHAAGTIPIDGKVSGTTATVGSTPQFRTSRTIPFWSSSFTYNGKTYPYTMVGSDPSSDTSTTVQTVIVPVKFVFSPASNFGGGDFNDVRDPYTVDPKTGLTTVAETLSSPIFQPARFPDSVGTTQYGDAVQRATFDKTGSSGYHLLLGQPTVLPEVTQSVPANQADVHQISARVDFGWFSNVLNQLTNQLHLSPTTLPIFVTYDTLLYSNNDPSSCCVFGYHSTYATRNGNGDQQVQTSLWSSWITPGIFDTPGIVDISGLSHEVAEWANDPFLANATPPWTVPTAPQYGCQALLEVGDPLVGFAFPMTLNGYTYHPQDVALLPWFARQVPSAAVAGAYTYPDTGIFTSPSPSC